MRGKYDFARRLRGQPGPRSTPGGSGFNYLHVSATGAPQTLLSRSNVHRIYNKTGQIASLIGSAGWGSDSRCPPWVRSGNAHNEPMMSAFTPLATFERTCRDVGVVPTSDIARLFDHLVGAGEELRTNFKAERFGSLEVNHELELSRLPNR